MDYGIKFHRTITDDRKRAIFEAIEEQKTGMVTFNRLMQIVCHERKIMSERIFRETLKEMVEEKLVARQPEKNSQKVYYSVWQGFFEAERTAEENIDKLIARIQQQIKSLGSVFKSLSTYDQAGCVMAVLINIFCTRTKIAMITWFQNTTMFQEKSVKILLLEKQLYDLVTKQSAQPFHVLDAVDTAIMGISGDVTKHWDYLITPSEK